MCDVCEAKSVVVSRVKRKICRWDEVSRVWGGTSIKVVSFKHNFPTKQNFPFEQNFPSKRNFLPNKTRVYVTKNSFRFRLCCDACRTYIPAFGLSLDVSLCEFHVFGMEILRPLQENSFSLSFASLPVCGLGGLGAAFGLPFNCFCQALLLLRQRMFVTFVHIFHIALLNLKVRIKLRLK